MFLLWTRVISTADIEDGSSRRGRSVIKEEPRSVMINEYSHCCNNLHKKQHIYDVKNNGWRCVCLCGQEFSRD